MRAAGYFRVSDEDQVDGYSMDAQRRAFTEFCTQKGWRATQTYSEEGRSAWLESIAGRPAFRRMLDDARARRFDVVVTHTLDRFSRNLRVMLDAFHTFSKHDVTYVSITQEIDYSTPEGKLFMTMLGAFAQYFSDALSGHTKKGMRERAQQGMFNGAPPFGYERCVPECIGLDESHPGCHLETAKAERVLEMFERYASGTDSMTGLASWLNSQGHRTNGKRRSEILGETIEADGRLFTSWAVRDILANPFYVGKVRYKDEYFDGQHEGLVSQELFDKVQQRRKVNRSRRSITGTGKSGNAHLLRGLLKCNECGIRLWSEAHGAKRETYYRSPDKGLDLACKYKGRSFVGRDFDAQANQLFREFRLRNDWIEYTIENCIRGSDAETALHKRQDIANKVDRAKQLYMHGDLSWPQFNRIKDQAEADMATIHVPEFDDAVEAGKLLVDFGILWDSASKVRRNRLLHTVLNAIYVDLDVRNVVGLQPKGTFMAPIIAMADRSDVAVLDASKECLGRDGGDGGESNSPSNGAFKNTSTGLAGSYFRL